MNTFTVFAIHVGGAHNKKSAFSVNRLSVKSVHTGYPNSSIEHANTCDLIRPLASRVNNLVVLPGQNTLAKQNTFIELQKLVTDIPSDQTLLQMLKDLEQPDILVFDAPLTMPPCTLCTKQCPGIPKCEVSEVKDMHSLLNLNHKLEKKKKFAQPYMDRFFEFYARSIITTQEHFLGHEFSAALGSNKAPLAVRAQYLRNACTTMFPKTFILETNSVVICMSLAKILPFKSPAHFLNKNGTAARDQRKNILWHLENSGIFKNVSVSHVQAFRNATQDLSAFYSIAAALAPWYLFSGEALFHNLPFNKDETPHWPIIPKLTLNYQHKPISKEYLS